VEIRVQSQNIEKALRDLKKKLQLDGLMGELKKRRHYEKPSVKKKNKQLEAEKRRRKLLKRARPSGGSGPRTGRPSTGSTGRPSSAPAASNTPVRS
jgi:small subunit ribosomal protein S21